MNDNIIDNKKDVLLKELDNCKKLLYREFGDEKTNMIKTFEIQKQIKRFNTTEVKPLVKEIEHVESVLKSSIHIGMLGRYSHGKSALVNALFDLNSECELPTGDGVVTSKVSYVNFGNEFKPTEAFKVMKNGDRDHIDIFALKNSVRKKDNDTSGINYYELTLCPDKPFSLEFARKKISLVDMPGLGGPYFNDEITTKKYIRELDMVIAVIRIDQIEDSAMHIDHLLNEIRVPVIPVLTFADDETWKKSEVYEDCRDLGEVVIKAKKLMIEYMPYIVSNSDSVVAVSSTSKERNGINALREKILNNIETTDIAISTGRHTPAPVYKKQLDTFKKEYNQLKSKLIKLCYDLENILKPIIPQTYDQNIDLVKKACEQSSVIHAEDDLKEELDSSLEDFLSKYEKKLEQVRRVNENDSIEDEIDRINEGTNKQIKNECTKKIDKRFEKYKVELWFALKDAIDKMAWDNRKKDNLKNKISKTINDSKLDYKDCFKVSNNDAQITKIRASVKAMQTANFVAGLAKHPQRIIMFVAGIVLIGCKDWRIGGDILFYVGIALAVGSVILHLIEQPKENRQFLDQEKDKIIDCLKGAFDKENEMSKLHKMLEDKIRTIKDDLKKDLEHDVSSFEDDAFDLKGVKESIEVMIDRVSNNLQEAIDEITINMK